MLFIKLAALFPLAAFTQAWVIPEGTADGVYAVTRDADGKDVHTRIDSADSALEVHYPDHELERRATNQIWCGCGFTINRDDTDSAVNKLKAQFGAGAVIQPQKSFYSITNGVVAFACSRSSAVGILSADEYGRALASITSACGLYISGAKELKDRLGGQAIITGYQRYKNGDDFCATSTLSPANHC